MKRIILLVLMAGILFVASHAFAGTLTLPEHLAKAIASADMHSSDGKTVTATLSQDTNASGDVTYTVSLDVDASSVTKMNFDSADLSGITSADFVSFDTYFSGLESLRLELPASYSGTFGLSLGHLAELDMSGSKADFNLSVYGFPKLESLKADNCPELKAVNLAAVIPVKEGSSSMMMIFGGGTQESTVATSPLSSLKHIDLSSCPALDRLGYVLSVDAGMFAGLFGTGGNTEPAGWKTHSVITIVRDATTYFPDDTSHPKGSAGLDISTLMGGDTSNDDGSIGTYSGKDVNLLPALASLNLKDSGTQDSDHISEIDIPNLLSLVSADFSGMTQLESLTLPAGETLTSLDLTGDAALLSLDLSDTRGFVFPEGFTTLAGLVKFRMSNRQEVDSVDVSSFTKLTELEMANDSLEALDVSSNTSLQKLYVSNNEILSLDLSKHSTLLTVDVRNNKLTKVDLSRNTSLRVNSNSAEDSAVSLSAQIREMDGARKKFFDFRDAGLGPKDFGHIVASSVKGDGTNALAFDPESGMAAFASYPSLITYDYESGLYYESSSEPICMSVRLLWDVSGQKPLISPVDARISGRVGDGEITPLVITADSYEAVTWTSSPETLPAGLEKIADSWSFTIGGEPNEEYDGTVIITARNSNGESESATVHIKIAPAAEETNTGPGTGTNVEVVPVPYPVPESAPSSGTEDSTAQLITVTPVSAEITASVDSGSITPVVIVADSYTPVTWTLYPEEMPAGLETTINGRVLVISGTPEAEFSGYLIVAATNEAGNSGYSAVKIEIATVQPEPESDDEPVPAPDIESDDEPVPLPPDVESDDEPAPVPPDVESDDEPVPDMPADNDVQSSGGSSGCNSGFGAVILAVIVMRKRSQ